MEIGFYHHDRGYWQTTGMPRQSVLDSYPEGTVQIELKPSPDHEWDGSAWVPFSRVITADEVNRERDKRINAGFRHGGHVYQSDPDSRENIAGAFNLALAFVSGGGDPDKSDWMTPGTDFGWRTRDNVEVPMTPAQMMDLGKAAVAHKAAHIYAARPLREADPIRADFADDPHWPVVDLS